MRPLNRPFFCCCWRGGSAVSAKELRTQMLMQIEQAVEMRPWLKIVGVYGNFSYGYWTIIVCLEWRCQIVTISRTGMNQAAWSWEDHGPRRRVYVLLGPGFFLGLIFLVKLYKLSKWNLVGWLSGRKRTIGVRVCRKVPWVRIPVPPLNGMLFE